MLRCVPRPRLTLWILDQRHFSLSTPNLAHQTPFQVLDLPPSSSRSQVIAQFHQLARSLHPDLAPASSSAEERQTRADKFKKVLAAYEVLKDDKKREAYERAGVGWDGGHGGEGRKERHDVGAYYAMWDEDKSRGWVHTPPRNPYIYLAHFGVLFSFVVYSVYTSPPRSSARERPGDPGMYRKPKRKPADEAA